MANEKILEFRLVKQEAGSTRGTRWDDWNAEEDLATFGRPLTDNIISSEDIEPLKI